MEQYFSTLLAILVDFGHDSLMGGIVQETLQFIACCTELCVLAMVVMVEDNQVKRLC
jgi:hypothetical protein